MTITQVYVSGIRAEGELQYQARNGSSTRWSPLAMQQSPLDRACGVHALLVGLAIVTHAPRSSLENLAEASRGPWRAFWELARGIYFEGSAAKDLQRCAGALENVSTREVRTQTPDKLYRVCLAAIEAGGVPLLDLDGPAIAHWTVVLGVESRAGKPSALLCLDPSVGAPWAAFTNARFDLTPDRKPARGKPLHSYRDTDGRIKQAHGYSVLLVMPKQQPP
ncbi:MAG: hypothetical protein J0L58_12135 [Burkholderiales bacterium]|nr:hypothetical protein [Burkholderiales bacterium]